MNREAQYKKFFQLTSEVTDLFPRIGARFLDFSLKNILGSGILLGALTKQAYRKVRSAKNLNSFLVVADLNIGDAVIASSAVNALRKIFPAAKIDLVIKKSTKDIVDGNPDLSDLYPLYVGAPFPTDNDLYMLAHIAHTKAYDLIINFSPMIEDKLFERRRVINFSIMAAELVKGEKLKTKPINNVSYQSYNFIGKVFHQSVPVDFYDLFRGANIYLSNHALETAINFLLRHGISFGKPIIMFNPDASSRFTRIPFSVQAELLKRISRFDCDILLGAAHVEKFIEYKLVECLQADLKRKIVIVPASMEVDAYTMLIDFADIFVTGDTGPLHLAAARKFLRESGESLRNETAVFSIFGGTPPRIYGYDSKTPGFFPANQDAPSRAFISASPCRNISCINKMAKTCKTVRCFQSIDQSEIIFEISSHLNLAQRVLERQNYFIPAE